jgi:DNA-3-methyladenine glycosylase II
MTPSAIEHLRDADPKLRDWIARLGPVRLPPRRSRDPYRALLESVVYQQLNGVAAGTIWNRVLDLFEDRDPHPEKLIAHSDTVLRSAGLSRNKISSLRAIAAGRISGDVPEAQRIARLADLEIYERLTRLRGVGPWTVDMLMIFTLRRPDVMPATDYGIRKGFQTAYRKRNLPTPKEVLARAERWRPFRTTAALYLWRIADEAKPRKAIS